jgi:DNA-binding NtrC family response regulator
MCLSTYFCARFFTQSDTTHPLAKPALLIVDDDPLIAESLSFVLSDDFDVRMSESRMAALTLMRDGKLSGKFVPALALIDLGLPPQADSPAEGFKLLGELLAFSPNIRVLVLTGQNQETNARRARALGAADLVPKPCEPAHLRRALLAALRSSEDLVAAAHGNSARNELTLVGESLPMHRLRSQIDLYANVRFPVLIEGESGSGKERVAAGLHHLSPNSHAPFLAINCAAISATLVEPTLFGYAKGAFTGASTAKAGYFEDAGEGILFLDEIGELPLELQPKLLRVLENGEYQRVGETQSRISRARVVAATNRDLRVEVKTGRFRADLFHRLSVLSITVPPLRTLEDDKLRLLDYFQRSFAPAQPLQPSVQPSPQIPLPQPSSSQAFTLSEEAKRLWLSYHFPGNVRELKNIVIRLMAKYAGYEVGVSELTMEFELPPNDVTSSAKLNIPDPRREIELASPFSLDAKMAELELAYIDAAIELARGNVSQAARLLGVSRTTLYGRLDTLRPSPPSDV